MSFGAYAQNVDIKYDPLNNNQSHRFKIRPGFPLTIDFPYPIKDILAGNSDDYVVMKLNDKTIGMKQKQRDEVSSGFTVSFTNGDKISFLLDTTYSNDFNLNVHFYEGKPPKGTKLEQKSKELESKFQQMVSEYQNSFQAKIDQHNNHHLLKRRKMVKVKGEKTSHGIYYRSRSKFIVGDRVYYVFEVTNLAYEKIDPHEIILQSFVLKTGRMTEVRLVESVKQCSSNLLKKGQTTECSFAYDYNATKDKRLMVEMETPSLKQSRLIILK